VLAKQPSSGGSREESVPCLLQLLEAADIPFLMTAPLQCLLLSSHLPLSLGLSYLFLSYVKDTCDYTELSASRT
jgi:hypothetical protein